MKHLDRAIAIAMIVSAAVLAIAYAAIKGGLAESLGLPAPASGILLVVLIVLHVVGAIRLLQRVRI